MGVHIREPLIRAECNTSRGPGSSLSGDSGVGRAREWRERDEKYHETIRGGGKKLWR